MIQKWMTFQNWSSDRLGYHADFNPGLNVFQRLKAGRH
jgi:hypothetical protein